jgi:hypothetical protein
MAAKITVTHTISWVPASGDSIGAKGSESFTQLGNAAIARTQDFTGTTAPVDSGNVAGDKYLFVKNLAEVANPPNPTADEANTLYIDQVTPVVPADAPYKLPPGKTMAIFTAQDTWYGISGGSAMQGFVSAIEP